MENKFFKVFCGALGFGALAMVLLTVVLCYGNYFMENEGIRIMKSCLLFAGLVSLISMYFMNRNYEKDAKNKAVKSLEDEKKKLEGEKETLQKQVESLQKEDLVKHQEKMALIKQMGKDAPNEQIVDLLEKYYNSAEPTDKKSEASAVSEQKESKD